MKPEIYLRLRNVVKKIYFLVKKPKKLEFPDTISLELNTTCNAHCKFCPQRKIKRLKLMPEEVFRKIIDESGGHKELKLIKPSLYGEPLIHPNLFERLRYIRKKLPHVRIRVITNSFALTREKSDRIIKENLCNEINFSIDAVDKKTFNEFIIVTIVFLILFSVAVSAFSVGNQNYKISGVISSGGDISDSTNYEIVTAVAQPIIGDSRNTDNIYLEDTSKSKYKLCLGVFCTRVFETAYSISITGNIIYDDTEEPVSDTESKLIIHYGDGKYESGTIETGENGEFSAEVSVPEYVVNQGFTIEVYANGRVEASYECTYCPDEDATNAGKCQPDGCRY